MSPQLRYLFGGHIWL